MGSSPSFGLVLGCVLGVILGVAVLSFAAYAGYCLFKRKRNSTVRFETPILPVAEAASRPQHHLQLNRVSTNSNKPLPGPPGSVHTASRVRYQRPSQVPQVPQVPPAPQSRRASGQTPSIASEHGTFRPRPPVGEPRRAPPVPASVTPFQKDPLKHTSQQSLAPSMHHSRGSAQISLDQDTLPQTLSLDHRPQELPEVRKSSQTARLISLFTRQKQPEVSQESLVTPVVEVALPQLPPLEFSGLELSFPAADKDRFMDDQWLPRAPLELPKSIPEDIEPQGSDIDSGNRQTLQPMPRLVTRAARTEPSPAITPQAPPRSQRRFLITEDADGVKKTRLPLMTSSREFDFEMSDDARERARQSQASSLFSNYNPQMSATLEDLRDQYRSSGLDLTFHTKDEYQRLTQLMQDSTSDLELDLQAHMSSESVETVRLAPPVEFSPPQSPTSPGAYEVRPLVILKPA